MSASRPEGRSTASSGRPEPFAAAIARAYAPATGRAMPMPKIASTITSSSIASPSNTPRAPAGSVELLAGAPRVAREITGWRDGEHLGRDAARARDACADVAVAAVLARPGQHRDRARRGPERADRVGQRVTGARHQLVSRDAAHLDRAPIEFAHLSGRINRARWRVHRLIIIAARTEPAVRHERDI